MRIFIATFCCFLFLGCASTVQQISEDTNVKPSENMGYVLLPIYRNTFIHQLRLSGAKYIQFNSDDLGRKQSYILVSLPKGSYKFDEIRLNKYTVISDFNEESGSNLWSFNVTAGVINYAGHFIVTNHSKSWNSYSLTYEIQNNASVALEYLEKHYPNLLQANDIIYSGPGDDDFFAYAKSIMPNKGE